MAECTEVGALVLALLALKVAALALYGVTERINAPWLPWFRRYLSIVPLFLGLYPPISKVVLLGTPILWWNVWTAARNRTGGRRGKPRLTLGQALTAVQALAVRREARACA